MSIFFKNFSDSAREFTRLKSIVVAALLVALHTVMSMFLSIQVTNTLRISISFLANVMIGYLFGPVMGFVCGGLGDIIQFVIKPTGQFFPGWTLNAALAGLIYGSFFYKKAPSKLWGKASEMPDEEKESKGKIIKLLNLLSIVVIIAGLVGWFTLPFIETFDKSTFEVLSQGTAFEIAGGLFKGAELYSSRLLALIILAGFIVAITGVVFKFTSISMSVELIVSFISILSVYTDKKSCTVDSGFIVVTAAAMVYFLIHFVCIILKQNVDASFLIRCIFTLTFDTLLVNVLLGTYWCTVMYGKGFAVYFTSRLVKNMVQLPINIVLTYYLLGIMKKINILKGLSDK